MQTTHAIVFGLAGWLWCACACADGIPAVIRLDDAAMAACFQAENGTVEPTQFDGVNGLRWAPAAGATSRMFFRPGDGLLQCLCWYDRMDFEFRIVRGAVSEAGLEMKGHVTGPRRYKVHQWNLAVATTEQGIWHKRILDLVRPNWFPWDNPDGEGADPFLRFSAVALEEGTVIEIRHLQLVRQKLMLKPDYEMPITWPVKTTRPGETTYTIQFNVLNVSGAPVVAVASVRSENKKFRCSFESNRAELKNGATAQFVLSATISKADIDSVPELYEEPLEVRIAPENEDDSACRWAGVLVRPFSETLRRQVIFGESELAAIRQQVASGNESVMKALDLAGTRKRADEFCEKRLDALPRGHAHVKNNYPSVAGSNPPDTIKPGAAMPAIKSESGALEESGTDLAGQVWKEYLAVSGQACESLGNAYLYTGDEKYAAKAVELLRLFGRQYAELEWNSAFDAPWNRGTPNLASSRIAASSTYGSNWYLKGLCRLASCVADSPAWTDETRKAVYLGFVLPYATELMKFPGGISNMTDVTNHNVLLLGIAFDDANLVRWALKSDPGLLSRLRDIDADGFSSEGRPINYHFAAMSEYLPSIGYLSNMGIAIDFPKERLLAAVRMPFQRAALTGHIPNSGDCGRWQNAGPNRLADALIPFFPEEAWLWDVGASGLRRVTAGVSEKPGNWKTLLETKPRLFREAGLAILRNGDTPEEQIQVTFDYGKALFHASLDRNTIALSAFGRVYAHGPGSLYNVGNGGMERGADKRLDSFCSHNSIGQNVILIDRESQLPTVGQLMAWNPEPAMQVVAARVDGVRPGVAHTRAVVLTEGLVIVLDRMESGTTHEYDFAYHNFGEFAPGDGWTLAPAGNPLGTTANFESIVDLKRAEGPAPFKGTWTLAPMNGKDGEARLHVWHASAPQGTIHVGVTGMNNPDTKKVPDIAPSIFSRVSGQTAHFMTVLEPAQGASRVQSVAGVDGGGVDVTLADGKKRSFKLDELIARYRVASEGKDGR